MEESNPTESAHQQKSPLKENVRSQSHKDIVRLEQVESVPQFNKYPSPQKFDFRAGLKA